VARAALAGGIDAIQFRDKEAEGLELYETAREIRRLAAERGVPFLVNDRLDVALAVDADGVHVGQRDLPAAVARRLIGPDKMLGVSATTLQEAALAESDGADYIGLGPIYETRATKRDAGEPLGLDLIRAVRAGCRVPIVAIGGIDESNIQAVFRTGADGVAVISGIVSALDIAGAVRKLKKLSTELGREK
jgi:thiamine-phosphate pyrophosphorylase